MHELYQVLGVRSGVADEEIKVAFRRLAKQLHPDLHPGDADAERRLKDVLRAYETLSDRPSRMAYDAGLANQRSMRRWRFRANAMTVVTVFALTVSVGLHWRVLSEALLPAGEHPTQLAGDETHTAMSDKAEGVTSSMQGGLPQAAEERGDAVPNKGPKLTAEPSYALLDLHLPTVADHSPSPRLPRHPHCNPCHWTIWRAATSLPPKKRPGRNARCLKLPTKPRAGAGPDGGSSFGHSM